LGLNEEVVLTGHDWFMTSTAISATVTTGKSLKGRPGGQIRGFGCKTIPYRPGNGGVGIEGHRQVHQVKTRTAQTSGHKLKRRDSLRRMGRVIRTGLMETGMGWLVRGCRD
jgi:hypothetical protein